MRGIRVHTHAERVRVLEEMVPLVRAKFGSNLLAVAARGSTARNTDGPYSDVELFAFLRKMPAGEPADGYGRIRKIRDGLLVECIWLTKRTYLREVKEISASWFGSGADVLLPLVHAEFIERINAYTPKRKAERCDAHAAAMWPMVRATSAAVIRIAKRKERTRMALAFHRMFDQVLNMLAFINRTPFTTYMRKIPEAAAFRWVPDSFPDLVRIAVEGRFDASAEIIRVVTSVRADLERYLIRADDHPARMRVVRKPRSDRFGMMDRAKRYEQAVATWEKVQESTTKVLNAAAARDVPGMTIVINDMFFQMLKILSCVNGVPLRFSRIIDDAKKLPYKPKGFADLVRIVERGRYAEVSNIRKAVTSVFTELEQHLEAKGFRLYQGDIDPGKPILYT